MHRQVIYIDRSGKEWGPAHCKHFIGLARVGVISIVARELYWVDTRASVAWQREFAFLSSLEDEIPEPLFRLSEEAGVHPLMTIQEMNGKFSQGVDYRLFLTDALTGITAPVAVVRGLRLCDESGSTLSGWRMRRVRSKSLSEAHRINLRNCRTLALLSLSCGLGFMAWSSIAPIIAFVGLVILAISGAMAWEAWLR